MAEIVDPDVLRLIAVEIAFPKGGITVSALRREIAGGRATALSALDFDIRLLRIAIFRQQNVDRLPTSVLVASLLSNEARRRSGEYPRDAQNLARLLRPLLIRPTPLPFKDGLARGYRRQWFEEALLRIEPGSSAGARS